MWKMNLFNDEGHPNWNKLMTYRLCKSDLETELYVKLAIQRDHLPIFAMFRCGNLPLNIETGRFAWPKLPMEQRTCFHCIDPVEDELHFLTDCPFYDDMRRKMFHKAKLCNRDFILYDSTEKWYFYWIMSICRQFWLQHYLICFGEGQKLFRHFIGVFYKKRISPHYNYFKRLLTYFNLCHLIQPWFFIVYERECILINKAVLVGCLLSW